MTTPVNEEITETVSKMNKDAIFTINILKDACKEFEKRFQNYETLLAEAKNNKPPAPTNSSEDQVAKDIQDASTEPTFDGYLRPKRTASKLAAHKINEQSNLKLNSKMRRLKISDKENEPSFISNGIACIKIEKDANSDENTNPKITLTDTTNVNLMPPPPPPPKRVLRQIKKEIDSDSDSENTYVTRTKVKLEKAENEVVSNTADTGRITRSTRTKKSQKRIDSDIIIQEPAVCVVVILDSDSEAHTSSNYENINNATPTMNTTEESLCKNEEENVSDVKEKTKVTKSKKRTKKATSKNRSISPTNDINKLNDIEQQLDTPKPSSNCTVVLHTINETVLLNSTTEPECIVNKTITLSSKNNGPITLDNILTDDESLEKKTLDNILTDDESLEEKTLKKNACEQPDIQKQPAINKATTTKPMFSPYESSPVKTRVAAFEKLGTTDNTNTATATRVTRTKTRKLLAEKESKPTTEVIRPPIKQKLITPLLSNKLPSMIPHTDGKLYRNKTNTSKLYNNTLISETSVKCVTSVKPSRAVMQEKREEEQRKRMEKENEVRRKKEAMLQAKTEEQKRKRVEKQLKAQKAREIKEREKEEKMRQIIQDKQDKLQEKRQGELLRKLDLATKKLAEAEEARKLEDQLKIAKLREQEAKKKQAEEKNKAELKSSAYKPTPLPTEDNEDSDSSSEEKSRNLGPLWGQKIQLDPVLRSDRHIPRHLIEALFQMKASTPDLRVMFNGIADHKLKRNSSAVWRTPPRYSRLTKF